MNWGSFVNKKMDFCIQTLGFMVVIGVKGYILVTNSICNIGKNEISYTNL